MVWKILYPINAFKTKNATGKVTFFIQTGNPI